jgi:hypothetical protein
MLINILTFPVLSFRDTRWIYPSQSGIVFYDLNANIQLPCIFCAEKFIGGPLFLLNRC